MATVDEIAVAMMLARGDAQTTIERVLGLPKRTVIRLKGQAVHQNKMLFYPNPRFVESKARPKSALAEAEALVNADALALLQKLRGPRRDSVLRAVHSLPSGTQRTPEERRRQIFGLAAAPLVYNLLLRSRWVGVAYGETVRSVISGMEFLLSAKPPSSDIAILPLRGDPIKERRGTRASSTSLAFECQEVLNSLWGRSSAKRARAWSLSGVPAIVPSSLRADARAIKRFAAENKTFRELFSGADRLAGKLDCILTSVGVTGEWGEYSSAYFASWGEEAWAAANLLGDMCGILIGKPILPGSTPTSTGVVPGGAIFKKKQKAWLGIEKRDFVGASAREPGVIMVVTSGGRPISKEAHRRYVQAKASVVYECCTTLNVVNHLIVDHEIMEQLLA